MHGSLDEGIIFGIDGTRCADNPISIIIPCHRVVGVNGSLTGFGGGRPQEERCSRSNQATDDR